MIGQTLRDAGLEEGCAIANSPTPFGMMHFMGECGPEVGGNLLSELTEIWIHPQPDLLVIGAETTNADLRDHLGRVDPQPDPDMIHRHDLVDSCHCLSHDLDDLLPMRIQFPLIIHDQANL